MVSESLIQQFTDTMAYWQSASFIFRKDLLGNLYFALFLMSFIKICDIALLIKVAW